MKLKEKFKMQRKKVIVCGSTFGQFYIHALQSMPERFELVGLEASIWSVWYEVNGLDPEWKSIPYGKALLNQKIKVMDEKGQERPTGEAGELWIGGIGVAEGYLNQPDLTQERFPIENGERWYRTGDKVRMMPDGNSEFLGRLDTQIKLGGFRIELGEIENVIKKKSSIVNAAAVVVENGAKKEIVAAVIPALNKEKIAKYDYNFVEKYEDDNLPERTNAVAALILHHYP